MQRANSLNETQARLAAGECWPTNLSADEFDALLIRVKGSAPAWQIGLSHILDVIQQPAECVRLDQPITQSALSYEGAVNG